MSDVTVVSNEFATLVFHPQSKIVHHTFHKTVGGEQFQNVLNHGIEMLSKHGAHKWLSDDRMNSALSDADTEWATTVWFQRAKAAGWTVWALVVPQGIMARLNLMDHINRYSEQGIRVMVFVDPDEAMRWLESQDAT
jgi:hypothetical protein